MTRLKTISKVLKLKGFRKEQLEAEVRKTNEKLNTEKARLDHLEDAFRNTVAEFNNKQDKGSFCICEMDIFYDYLSHLNRQTEKQREIILRLHTELEVKKRAMFEAHKEKRLFEKLQDKIVFEDIRETSLDEQKESDFNFISRKSRR